MNKIDNPGICVTYKRKEVRESRFFTSSVSTECDSTFNLPWFTSNFSFISVSEKVFHLKKMSQLPEIS